MFFSVLEGLCWIEPRKSRVLYHTVANQILPGSHTVRLQRQQLFPTIVLSPATGIQRHFPRQGMAFNFLVSRTSSAYLGLSNMWLVYCGKRYDSSHPLPVLKECPEVHEPSLRPLHFSRRCCVPRYTKVGQKHLEK